MAAELGTVRLSLDGEAGPKDKDQVNFTDEESRIMPGANGERCVEQDIEPYIAGSRRGLEYRCRSPRRFPACSGRLARYFRPACGRLTGGACLGGLGVPDRARIADRELVRRLDANGAVVIEGVKACGKTATARQVAAGEVLLDSDENARRALAVDPALVLEGAVPRLLDEWQIEPAIWNHVRRTVDDRGTSGQFILTGSAVPADDIVRHTGAGRLTRLHLRPMSLFETGHSSGVVSLQQLLGGHSAAHLESELPLSQLAEHIAVGGWPAHLQRSANQSLQANRDYLNEIRRVDVARVDGVRRDPVKVGRFLHSFARHVATYAAVSTMAADLNNHTADAYLSALERLMIIEDQPAWAPHLRSRSRLRGAAKRHYVDPSLAVAALRADPDSLL